MVMSKKQDPIGILERIEKRNSTSILINAKQHWWL